MTRFIPLGLALAALTAPPPLAGQQLRAERPIAGPLAPDMPLAAAYDASARALAMADDNPLIRWEYRVWCQTGYRTPGEAGTGQAIDRPVDSSLDLASTKGFLAIDSARDMPAGGVRFMDNAWYFGTDLTGMVVVKTADALLLFDTLTSPHDLQVQFLDQMKTAGLDPAQIRYVFMGHWHPDHIGGANLIRQKYAPNARFVMGGPDADMVARMRRGVLDGTAPDRGPGAQERATLTPEQRTAARLMAIPDRIDIRVDAVPGATTGSLIVDVGAATKVTALLTPGHTDGQMTVIVPVTLNGKPHRLVIWSGNDRIENALQYAVSADYVRSVAGAEGADAFINTHGYQGAAFYHLRQLKADPRARNPFLMGQSGVDRYLGIFGACQRAEAQRIEDGTWKAL